MLLVIGLDGATFNLLRPWMEKGYLPALAQLAKSGAHGVMPSTTPPITAPAWASFMTGKNPGKHSVFDFFRQRVGETRLVTADDIVGRHLWEYLSQAGLRVGVVNVPMTYPPRPVNGYLIPGLLSPGEAIATFPWKFLDAYKAKLGCYRLTPRVRFMPGNERIFLSELEEVLTSRIRYAVMLAKDHPVDFMMVHFLVTDIAQHALWKHLDQSHPWYDSKRSSEYGNAVRDIYRRIDSAVSDLLSILPPNTTTIVMSDHGFGPVQYTVNLNLYFLQTGLMHLKDNPRTQFRSWVFRKRFAHLGAKVARRLNMPWDGKMIGFEDVDWSRTVAYSIGHLGQVFLNLEEREPFGIVKETNYLSTRNEVIQVLGSLQHPKTGKVLVNEIIPREEVAYGPYLNHGPDLHLVMDEYRAVAYPMFASDGKVVIERRHFNSGNHRREGILIASGPEFQQGVVLNSAQITDLAPTILHLSGVPIPDDMDGHVLEDALVSDFQARNPVRYQPAPEIPQTAGKLSLVEEAGIETRLRDLGYLE